MVWNYLKVAARNLARQRGYTLINVAGLSIGLAVCLMIALFVADELSWDRFHENGDRVYRLVMRWRGTTGQWIETASGQYRVRDALLTDFPEFEHVIRVRGYGTMVAYGDKRFRESRFFFADHGFFDVFSFPLLKGDPSTALVEPFSVVVTPETAQRYFGDADPMGKTLTFSGMHDLKVTGIISAAPRRSHFHYDLIASMSTGEHTFRRTVKENWGEGAVHVYVLAPKGFDFRAWRDKTPAFIAKHIGERKAETRGFRLEPLRDIHLRSQVRNQFEPGGDIAYVYAFSAIAVFILLIACFNFMNLSTARSAGRAREVGVRKVVGATRRQLALQFLAESVLLALVCVWIGAGIVDLAVPYFNAAVDTELSMDTVPLPVILLLGVALVTGLIAGSYPALFLAAFDPVRIIKGRVLLSGGGLRRVLVTSQFAITITLVALTATVYQQIAFTRDIRLGYDKEHVIVVESIPERFREKVEAAKSTYLAHPAVSHVALSSRYPSGRLSSSFGVYAEDLPPEDHQDLQTVWVGYDFVEALRIPLKAGRSFERKYSEAYRSFMLNESAVRGYGWTPEEAVGKRLRGRLHIVEEDGNWEEAAGTVVGVVKDVYFESLREPIKPVVYFLAPRMAWYMLVRVRPGRVEDAIAHLEDVWPSIHPGEPIRYGFLDERFDRLYRKEVLQGHMFGGFAGLAVFVACLGLIGLASFSAERRTKEIGVRKVLGASAHSLVLMLSSEYTRLVVIASLVAWPVAWYLGEAWLSSFVYRTEIGIPAFAACGVVVLAVALLTVVGQALRAATSNLVEALRYE